MLVLGIESTCDETSAAVVQGGCAILSNIISSQTELHKQFKGVFPELASRRHLDDLLPIIDQAILQARITPEEIDLIAVANRPGLMGALLLGVITAKTLSLAWNKPLVGVNHVKAHLYAAMMPRLKEVKYPALGIVISGGHTFLAKIKTPTDYELLGQTVDDAIGESFDKVASLLELPYPGGPEIEKMARKGDRLRYPFKGGVVKDNPLNFSFSGLKTNVLYTLKGQSCQKEAPTLLPKEEWPHIAASFQHAAFTSIIDKALHAATLHNCEEIYVGGGVSFNQYLRRLFAERSQIPVYWPQGSLCLDNAAMIAGLGWQIYRSDKKAADIDIEATPSGVLNVLD